MKRRFYGCSSFVRFVCIAERDLIDFLELDRQKVYLPSLTLFGWNSKDFFTGFNRLIDRMDELRLRRPSSPSTSCLLGKTLNDVLII